jgi:hypothetical protein
MPFLTEANRQAFSITMMDALAHVVDTHADLAAIDKTDARMMFTHGIDEGGFGATSEACHFLQGESPCLEFKGVNS